MRRIKKVGVWPVGISGKFAVERPLVNGTGHVYDFIAWAKDRPFPIDMAGFAVNYRCVFSFPRKWNC